MNQELVGEGCGAEPSTAAPGMSWFNDTGVGSPLLQPIQLGSTFNRNTNVTHFHDQSYSIPGRKKGSCYAHSACSAYINTISRIYGAPPAPSFAQCFPIADYAYGEGGQPYESLRRLENKFGFGVRFEQMPSRNHPLIREMMMISLILCFTTSDEGLHKIADGKLFVKPSGTPNRMHACLIEGFDFGTMSTICKNSWGENGHAGRFKCRFLAFHDFFIVKVFHTQKSVEGKVNAIFFPRVERFITILNKKAIHCAWMDERTANYSDEYVCQPVMSHPGPLKYLGYNIYEYVKLMNDYWS